MLLKVQWQDIIDNWDIVEAEKIYSSSVRSLRRKP